MRAWRPFGTNVWRLVTDPGTLQRLRMTQALANQVKILLEREAQAAEALGSRHKSATQTFGRNGREHMSQ